MTPRDIGTGQTECHGAAMGSMEGKKLWHLDNAQYTKVGKKVPTYLMSSAINLGEAALAPMLSVNGAAQRCIWSHVKMIVNDEGTYLA